MSKYIIRRTSFNGTIIARIGRSRNEIANAMPKVMSPKKRKKKKFSIYTKYDE